MRPRWPQRMLNVAELWSSYSTCKRRKVGAVIYHVKTKAVISIGYNDTPMGAIDCGNGGCPVCEGSISTSLYLDCKCVHAETNAILLAANRGVAVGGCSIAVWTHDNIGPCSSCRKHLIQAGILYTITPARPNEYTASKPGINDEPIITKVVL